MVYIPRMNDETFVTALLAQAIPITKLAVESGLAPEHAGPFLRSDVIYGIDLDKQEIRAFYGPLDFLDQYAPHRWVSVAYASSQTLACYGLPNVTQLHTLIGLCRIFRGTCNYRSPVGSDMGDRAAGRSRLPRARRRWTR